MVRSVSRGKRFTTISISKVARDLLLSKKSVRAETYDEIILRGKWD